MFKEYNIIHISKVRKKSFCMKIISYTYSGNYNLKNQGKNDAGR